MHPRLFQFGHFLVPTYGVVIALSLLVGLWVSVAAARLLGLNATKVWNLLLVAAAFTLVDAKLILTISHWAAYGPQAFALDLAVAPGALAAGTLTGIIAGWLYARRAQLPLRKTADALAPALAAGAAIAWIADLEAGYAFGSLTSGPLAIMFTDSSAAQGVPLGVPLHPVQIYGAVIDLVLFIVLLIFLRLRHRDGEVMGAWLFLSGLSSFFLTFLRGDDWARTPVAGFLSGAQWLALALVLAGGLLWLRRGNDSVAPDAQLKPQSLSHA